MNNYSTIASDLFDRVQHGKENSFAACWQKGLPGIIRCGNVSGEILKATVSFTAADVYRTTFNELIQPGADNTILLVSRRNGKAHFSLMVDRMEVLNSEADGVTGVLSVIASQSSGKGFAVVAFWAPGEENTPSSFLLAGSDKDFISFAISCSKFAKEALV
jgi:hypothetical protein